MILTMRRPHDVELLQFVNYQVDRWQEAVMKEFQYVHPNNLAADEEYRPDPIATLLYLRANQLHILLLRPFFFSDSVLDPDPDMVGRGLAIASDTICVLCHLDANTDNYRRQYAFFSHFLSSAAALILLIITHQTQPDASGNAGRAVISQTVRQPLKNAMKLASAYASSSAYSMKLHQKIVSIVGILSRLNIISVHQPSHESAAQYTNRIAQHKNHNGMVSPAEAVVNIYPSPDLTSAVSTQSQYAGPGMDMIDNIDADLVAAAPFPDTQEDLGLSLNGSVWNELDRWLSVHDTFPALENGHGFSTFRSGS